MTNFNEKTFALFSNPTNKKVVVELEKTGAKVFLFPPLVAEKTILDAKAIDRIKKLGEFDWLIFPDVLTVDYFLEILQENEIDLFEMDSARVCAFGETVSDRMRFVQLHADVIPNSVDAHNVFLAISDYIGRDEFCGLKFLFPKEVSQQYELKNKLVAAGASVFELPIYKAVISSTDKITKLKTLLKGGAIDEFIISSPTDLIALQNYFDNEPLAKTLAQINISAVNKETLQTLKEFDIKANYFQLK